MIQLNKQLQRLDGGVVPQLSLIDFQYRVNVPTQQVIFRIKHHFNQAAKDSLKPYISGVENFWYKQTKDCSADEWADYLATDPADIQFLVQEWLKEIIDGLIGVGYTEII